MTLGFIDSIWDSLRLNGGPCAGELSGQKITLDRKQIEVIISIDSNNLMHLLVSPAPSSVKKLEKFSFRGLEFKVCQWIVAGKNSKSYLDISCSGDLDSPRRRPFSKFCEDFIAELEASNDEIVTSLHRTCTRWKNFWETVEKGVSGPEWERGLLAELLILESLLEANIEGAVDTWVGPSSADQDFIYGKFGLEVKSTISIPAKVQVNNLRQLDPSLFDQLYLCLYQFSPSTDGISLRQKVYEIETLIEGSHGMLDAYWSKLNQAGYQIVADEMYEKRKYKIENMSLFKIEKNFPKIVTDSFAEPIDNRIEGINYKILMTDLDAFIQDDLEVFINKIRDIRTLD